MSTESSKPHGNTGNRNAAKAPEDRKPRRHYQTIQFRAEEVRDWKERAAIEGIALAEYVRRKVNSAS